MNKDDIQKLVRKHAETLTTNTKKALIKSFVPEEDFDSLEDETYNLNAPQGELLSAMLDACFAFTTILITNVLSEIAESSQTPDELPQQNP
mgnify:CR=1 FL=1